MIQASTFVTTGRASYRQDFLDHVLTLGLSGSFTHDIVGRSGDDVYHETWVHENAHLAWAIVVPEAEASRTKMFTEGLATMTEIDFSKSLFPAEDRDFYLARRYASVFIHVPVFDKHRVCLVFQHIADGQPTGPEVRLQIDARGVTKNPLTGAYINVLANHPRTWKF